MLAMVGPDRGMVSMPCTRSLTTNIRNKKHALSDARILPCPADASYQRESFKPYGVPKPYRVPSYVSDRFDHKKQLALYERSPCTEDVLHN